MEEENSKKLFVGNVSFDCNQEQFNEKFKSFSGFVDSQLVLDQKTGKSKGFGFITFESSDDVNKLLEQIDLELCGRKLYLNKFTDKTDKTYKLFLRNLPTDVNDEELNDLLKNEVESFASLKLNKNKENNESTGTGVLFLKDYDNMKKLLSDKELQVNNEKVKVYPFKPLNKRTNKKLFF